jgi:HlyD family secretion protein
VTLHRFAVTVALLMATLVLSACEKKPTDTYQGWIEADLVFVSPDENGRVETLSVKEGDTVTKGAPLFTLDDELQQADADVARAAAENAKQALDRASKLYKTRVGTEKAFEDAEASQRTADARLNAARTRLTRRKMFSPVSGSVEQIYFRPGEMVTAGHPVVALLPPANVKVRFFVPEAVLPRLKLGETVTVSCDGCPDGLTARVSFIARSAEYTPPVIYSLEERSKLVFMIEARPEHPEKLRVGQPVTVKLSNPPTAPSPPSPPNKPKPPAAS